MDGTGRGHGQLNLSGGKAGMWDPEPVCPWTGSSGADTSFYPGGPVGSSPERRAHSHCSLVLGAGVHRTGGPARHPTLHARPHCPAFPRAGGAARYGSAQPTEEDPRGL